MVPRDHVSHVLLFDLVFLEYMDIAIKKDISIMIPFYVNIGNSSV